MPETLIAALLRPRRLSVLVALSAVLGVAYALCSVPIGLLMGTSSYWDFPNLGGPLGSMDVADVLLGHLYYVQAPWGWPLLHIANLGAPSGTNLYWLDAIPWLALFGKLVAGVTGSPVHLLGPYWVLCLVGPGTAMTWLLFVAGQRSLLGAGAATLLADSALPLIGRGGGLALSAQFLIVLALALYLHSQKTQAGRLVGLAWTTLLVFTVLTNAYLFVMIGGIWAAALVQRGLAQHTARAVLLGEAAAAVGSVLAVAYISGILGPDLAGAGAQGFGYASMNLAAPFVPQWSGVIWPLSTYRIGHGGQMDTVNYLGLGVLLLLVCAIPYGLGWVQRAARKHLCLIVVLSSFVVYALSNNVYLGSRLLLHVPLPEQVVLALGTLRASIRFFWPVYYAFIGLALVLVLRAWPPRVVALMLPLAVALQLVDTEPTRRFLAANAARPEKPALDRTQIAAELYGASAVLVFPSWGCVLPLVEAGAVPTVQRERLLQQNVEIQLLAARANRPINSVYNARLRPDCAAEARNRTAPLGPGTVAFTLAGVPAPTAARCRMIGDVQACRAAD